MAQEQRRSHHSIAWTFTTPREYPPEKLVLVFNVSYLHWQTSNKISEKFNKHMVEDGVRLCMHRYMKVINELNLAQDIA